MEDLFKIDKIDGKGLGWIALQDIKAGTLICKEKPQFVDGGSLFAAHFDFDELFFCHE